MKKKLVFIFSLILLTPQLFFANTNTNKHHIRIYGAVGTGYPAFFNYGGGLTYSYQFDKLQSLNLDTSFWGSDDFNLNAVGMKKPFTFNIITAYALGYTKPNHKVSFDILGVGYSLVNSEREYKTLSSTLTKHGLLLVLPSLHVTYKYGIYTGWRNTFTYFVNYSRAGDSVFNAPLSGSEKFEFKTYLTLGYEFDF